jgi:hypothetical protein
VGGLSGRSQLSVLSVGSRPARSSNLRPWRSKRCQCRRGVAISEDVDRFARTRQGTTAGADLLTWSDEDGDLQGFCVRGRVSWPATWLIVVRAVPLPAQPVRKVPAKYGVFETRQQATTTTPR